MWTLVFSHFCTLRATPICFVYFALFMRYTRTLEKMHNTRSLKCVCFQSFRFSAVLFHFFCMYYIFHNLMYVFVYATHKKTELVWKIQPRFVFFFVWNIQFLDLNFEFLINNSRKKWKTIMLFRANYAGFFLSFMIRLLHWPSTDWFRHRCIYYFNILSRMNETNINIFCFFLFLYFT